MASCREAGGNATGGRYKRLGMVFFVAKWQHKLWPKEVNERAWWSVIGKL